MDLRGSALFVALSFVLLHVVQEGAAASSSGDGNEQWGYVQVWQKAHVFWWLYKSPQRVSSLAKPWPTILWLQGGPGGSGVGRGNFLEIGLLDANLKQRNSTWLQKADLIFVVSELFLHHIPFKVICIESNEYVGMQDLPVGVGYSYTEDPSVIATTDLQVAADAIELLSALTKKIPTLQSSPLFLVGESYGGKLAAMIGISMSRAIHAGILQLTLGGVVLGDSWISPDDFALSYAQLLHDMSRLNDNAVAPANKMAATLKEEMALGQFATARKIWIDLLDLIDSETDSVNMENLLLESNMNSLLAQSAPNTIDDIMNGAIKRKLKIIPKDLIWQQVSIPVYKAMANTFMKPAINEVDELLSHGVDVTVYNGQLDVICSTIGVEGWVKKLKWDGLKNFLSLSRQPCDCDSSGHCSGPIKSYVRSFKNLHFYWILGAGHAVPIDQPDTALKMIGSITHSSRK
ncbi:hypothetical protein ACQ4PT_042075 [Festuca glaucescens]